MYHVPLDVVMKEVKMGIGSMGMRCMEIYVRMENDILAKRVYVWECAEEVD